MSKAKQYTLYVCELCGTEWVMRDWDQGPRGCVAPTKDGVNGAIVWGQLCRSCGAAMRAAIEKVVEERRVKEGER